MPPELELVQQWLGRARSDLHIAQGILDMRDPEPAGACFHCQQAAEKLLKAFLVYHGVDYEWTHEIERLIQQCAQLDSSFGTLHPDADPLTNYAVRFRYPDEDPDPSITQGQQALAVARRVWQFILDRLPAEVHP